MHFLGAWFCMFVHLSVCNLEISATKEPRDFAVLLDASLQSLGLQKPKIF